MDNKKIILITNEYLPKRGGAGVYCEELIYASKELGISIEGWIPQYAKIEKNSNFISLPIKGSQDWICSWRIIKHFNEQQAKMPKNTVLHLAEPGSLRAFIRFGWIFKELPKLLITIHGSELIRFCKNPVESFLFKKLLEQTKTVHVLSKFNQEQVERFCPVIKERILLLPGAAARKVKGDLGKKEKAVKTMIKVLCVGRIHPRKGQDLLIDAVCALPTDLKKKLECVFVGPIVKKKFFRELQEKVASINCKVTFLGELADEELKMVYESADIFALASMPRAKSIEGFGFVYLEASSHGLPILAHRTGGVEDAVKENETGILTDPKIPIELRNGLEKLINDFSLRKRLGNAGKDWANKNSWTKIAKQIYQSD